LDPLFEFVEVTLVVKGMKTPSLKQIAANRENAKKSSGPRTPAGKAASSRNALRHGLYSAELVLPCEDVDEFRALARRLSIAYAPRDTLEEETVRDILMARVRLRRFEKVEQELYRVYGYYESEDRGVGTAFANDATQGNAFSKLAGCRSLARRELSQAMRELESLKEREIPCQPIGGGSARGEACAPSYSVPLGDVQNSENAESTHAAATVHGTVLSDRDLKGKAPHE